MAVPGAGRFAGWRSSVWRAWSRSPCSLGFARLNPVTVPSQVQISSSLAPQYQREWLAQYPYAGVPVQVRALRGDGGLPHGTGVASISRSSSAVAGVASASHRSAASISGAQVPQPQVVLALAQQSREQVPDELRRGAQPAPLAVAAQQDLRDGQAGQLGVGDLRRPARPAAAEPAQRDDPVGQFHVECGQESVQVGDHDGLQGPDVCENADSGHSSLTGHAPLQRVAVRPSRQPRNTDQRSRRRSGSASGAPPRVRTRQSGVLWRVRLAREAPPRPRKPPALTSRF